jgi:hypothetical protein
MDAGARRRTYEDKHFSGKRDSAHFMRHKSYRRMLYQLRIGAQGIMP